MWILGAANFFLERTLRSSRSFPRREGIREQLFCKGVNANVLFAGFSESASSDLDTSLPLLNPLKQK